MHRIDILGQVSAATRAFETVALTRLGGHLLTALAALCQWRQAAGQPHGGSEEVV